MKQETFKQLSLDKKMKLYNEWLVVNHLDEYVLYPNDDEGIELCFERNLSTMCSAVDFVDELTHSTHYDISDRLVMYDRDIPYGFKSLPDVEIDGYFSQKNFMDWLEGLKGSDYNAS